MKGIVDRDTRKRNLYRTGGWEHGGWFHEAQKDVYAADTRPTGEPPVNQVADSPAPEGVKIAAAAEEDPFVKEEDSREQTQEQLRLAASQSEGGPKAHSMPELSQRRTDLSGETITNQQMVSSPGPIPPTESES